MTRAALLARQLRRASLSAASPPSLEQWQRFLETVERTYEAAEQDRYTIERSLAISSTEMQDLYENLKRTSESQLAEEHAKLQKNVAIHEAILEAALDGVLVVDQDQKLVSRSRRFTELWDLEDHEARSAVAAKTVDPEAFHVRVQEIYSTTDGSQDELSLVDGRSIDRISSPIRAETGEYYGRVWFFRDVTSRKRQDDQIREANRFLDSIIENIPHMVIVKDAATLRFVRVNRAGAHLLGASKDSLIGKSDHDVFPADRAAVFLAADRKALSLRGIATVAEEPIETSRGTRWLSSKTIPICNEVGVPVYLLCISEDITEQLRKRDELLTAKELAETASRAKSDFLLNMSHEMRTPLNAILGFGRLLQREVQGLVSADNEEYLKHVVAASEHMLALVNDLLDLRSLEAHGLEVARVELAPVFLETVSLLRPLIDEKELHMNIELAGDLPYVMADRRAVVQILINLISNAAKFTPCGGSIVLTAAVNASRVEVSVRDTGVGIAQADQSKLFTYFEQVGEKHNHHMKGSGVGLALTRALVERQGGQITVRSVPGQGSTFNFDLQAAS